MPHHTLQVSFDGALATVTLDRPEVRNAFNEATIVDLAHVFDSLAGNDAVRAIVLAANGSAFCAGADLHWMKKMARHTHAENLADAGQLAAMLRTIYLCPKPVVAKVQGDCYAGGMGLVAACDIVVAAEEVHFCLSEVKLGLIPATIAPYVIKAIGEQAARRYFLTAERFDAREAHRIGLAHAVVPAAELSDKVSAIAKALLANGPQAVRQAKILVREVAGQTVTDALVQDTAERIAQIRASSEGREGVLSFLEKRKPDWLT